MQLTVKEIAEVLKGEVDGDEDKVINTLSKIQDAKNGSISFLSNPKYENFVYSTRASAVIVSNAFEPRKKINTTLVRVEDPYSAFSVLLEEYQKLIMFEKTGVEEPSFIGENSISGKKIYRGAFSYIGKEVTIGSNTKIYPQVYIGDECEIGNNTILYPGVKVYAGSKIGNNCVLHSGAVIGSHGFGFAPQKDSTYKTIPQMGNVIIKDNVDVGANTAIDCATFQSDSTVISEGVKLDNLIQVGHNVVIGENTVIAGQTGISGSTKIGANCVIAGQVGIIGHVEIGDNTKIAAQSGIGKDTGENEVMMGSPAFEHKKYLRVYTIFKKLPELEARLKELEEKILNLPTF